jgi:hypothetical protein
MYKVGQLTINDELYKAGVFAITDVPHKDGQLTTIEM